MKGEVFLNKLFYSTVLLGNKDLYLKLLSFHFPAIVYIRFSESRIIWFNFFSFHLNLQTPKVYIHRTGSEKLRASAKLDRSRVNSEDEGHYVSSFFVPLPTIGMNSYDLLNFFTR